MRHEPLNHFLRREPAIKKSKASDFLVLDKILLPREMCNESSDGRKEALHDDVVHEFLQNEIQIMRRTPRSNQWALLIHLIVEVDDNSSVASSHATGAIWRDAGWSNVPIVAKTAQEHPIDPTHDFASMLIKHRLRNSMHTYNVVE